MTPSGSSGGPLKGARPLVWELLNYLTVPHILLSYIKPVTEHFAAE